MASKKTDTDVGDTPEPAPKKPRERTGALPASVWIAQAHTALDSTPEVVRAALSLKQADTYNRAEVVQAIDAYMKRPVR